MSAVSFLDDRLLPFFELEIRKFVGSTIQMFFYLLDGEHSFVLFPTVYDSSNL